MVRFIYYIQSTKYWYLRKLVILKIKKDGGFAMSDHPLSLFISGWTKELFEERRAVQEAGATYQMFGWLWERYASTPGVGA